MIKITDFGNKIKEVVKALKKNLLIIIALIAGLLLLTIPWGSGGTAKTEETQSLQAPEFKLHEQEKKLEEALSKIEGAGGVTVVLTLKADIEQQIAWDEEMSYKNSESGTYDMTSKNTAVRLQSGSGRQLPVTVKYVYPVYQGALVITQSASAAVKLRITEAVAALTGLSTDKITVAKGE